jgi:hypothetical protein
MGLTSVREMLAARAPAPRRQVKPDARHVAPPAPATILRYCRCSDCLNFSRVEGEYFCSQHIGGTAVVWATGQRFCEPPPDAWHYCALYRGPRVSKDILVWRRATPRAAQVGAGSKSPADPANPTARTDGRDVGEPSAAEASAKAGDVNGSLATSYAEDRDGNGREGSVCLLRTRT